MVIDNEVHDHWETKKMDYCLSRTLKEDGTLGLVPGLTEDTFQATSKAFLHLYLGKTQGKCQVTYLWNHLKWLYKLDAKTCAARLKVINAIITKFLDDVKPLKSNELKDIFIQMAPVQFRNTLKTTKSPKNMSLDEVVDYFEMLEWVFKMLNTSPSSKQDGSQSKSGHFKKRKKGDKQVLATMPALPSSASATGTAASKGILQKPEGSTRKKNVPCAIIMAVRSTLTTQLSATTGSKMVFPSLNANVAKKKSGKSSPR